MHLLHAALLVHGVHDLLHHFQPLLLLPREPLPVGVPPGTSVSIRPPLSRIIRVRRERQAKRAQGGNVSEDEVNQRAKIARCSNPQDRRGENNNSSRRGRTLQLL